MYTLILILHILVAVVLVVVVLVQSGKGGGLGGMFGGGGGSDALFSAPSGSSFIKKVTVGLAIAFICTTLFLTVLQNRRAGRSVIQRIGVPQTQGQ